MDINHLRDIFLKIKETDRKGEELDYVDMEILIYFMEDLTGDKKITYLVRIMDSWYIEVFFDYEDKMFIMDMFKNVLYFSNVSQIINLINKPGDRIFNLIEYDVSARDNNKYIKVLNS